MPREYCPYLPKPSGAMSYRSLTAGKGRGVEVYYQAALTYGHYLWLEGSSGRAILALTRALYADVGDGAAVLERWPLPYKALCWLVYTHPGLDFPGNPRISFQHQATRLRGERRALRRARAWAVWALIRRAKPGLPADSRQAIQEPTPLKIERGLVEYGHRYEVQLWREAMEMRLR